MHIGIALVTVIDQGVKYFYKLLPVHSGILQFRTEFSCVFPEHPVTLRNMQAQFLQAGTSQHELVRTDVLCRVVDIEHSQNTVKRILPGTSAHSRALVFDLPKFGYM